MLWRGARDVADAKDTDCIPPGVLPLRKERWKEGGGGGRDTQPAFSQCESRADKERLNSESGNCSGVLSLDCVRITWELEKY